MDKKSMNSNGGKNQREERKEGERKGGLLKLHSHGI